MTILSSTPVQDRLHLFNSILDSLDQAKHLARKNQCAQRVLDAIDNTTAIVFYEMKKVETLANQFDQEYPADFTNDR